MRSALRVTEYPNSPAPIDPGDDHRALIARVAENGDRKAFAALFAYFGPRIKTVMIKAGSDQALAEDLVQDVMLAVWRKSKQFTPDRGTVSSWIFTIARNARIDRLRRHSSRPYEDVDEIELTCDGPSAEDEFFAGQQANRVGDALASLPEEQRQVIELAFLNDISQREIATKLSLPLGTVKSRMRLAYAKLRTELEDVK